MSGLHTCQVRTTHGKTRLRAKRSFGPAPVTVDLTEHEMDLINADPFLEIRVQVGMNPALALAAQQELDEQAAQEKYWAECEAEAHDKLQIPGKSRKQLADEADADDKLLSKPVVKSPVKKAKG